MLNNRKTKAMVILPRQQGRKQHGSARRSAATGPRGLIPHPPQINDYEVHHKKTLRFTAGAAVSQNITFQNLLDTIVIGNATNTLLSDLFFAVKLGRIKIWSTPIIGQVATVQVVFDGTAAGFVGDRKVHTDTSMGIEPAYVSCTPAKESLASKFQVSSSAVAFNIVCPAGSVIDINLTFRSDVITGSNVAAQNTAAGATGEFIQFRGLDGLAVATSKMLPPAGVNQV